MTYMSTKNHYYPLGRLLRNVVETQSVLASIECVHEPGIGVFPRTPRKHLVLIVDCSGSMGTLPQLRADLAKMLPSRVLPEDKISIIWFSSAKQCGFVCDSMQVNDLRDLSRLQGMLSWLNPMALTGFKDPIELALAMPEEPGRVWEYHFMSDGMENQNDRGLVVDAFQSLGKRGNVTVVEYGYYADRAFLKRLAQAAKGQYVFSETYGSYVMELQRVIEGSVSCTTVTIRLPTEPVGGFVWAIHPDSKSLVVYRAKTHSAEVTSRGSTSVYWDVEVPAEIVTGAGKIWGLFTDSYRGSVEGSQHHIMTMPFDTAGDGYPVGMGVVDFFNRHIPEFLTGAYAGAAAMIDNGRMNEASKLLFALGDKHYTDKLANCFGKQQTSKLQKALVTAAKDPKQRWFEGYSDAIPNEYAFSVMDLLELLTQDEGNRILLDDPKFVYNRVGRARTSRESAKFRATEQTDGYPVDRLVFNSTRPNVSIQVTKQGHVDIPIIGPDMISSSLRSQLESIAVAETANAKVGEAPKLVLHDTTVTVKSQVIRNYTIILDGIVNAEELPLRVTLETLAALEAAKASCTIYNLVDTTENRYADIIVHLTQMPVVNRATVKKVESDPLILVKNAFQIETLNAATKVYNGYYEKHTKEVARTSEKMEARFGKDVAEWLRSRGVTDHGFSPLSDTVAAEDYYMGVELKIALKGLSSLPSVAEAQKKIEAYDKQDPQKRKPLTLGVALLQKPLEELEAMVKANDGRTKSVSAWCDASSVKLRAARRKAQAFQARAVFAIIVGQTWFGRQDRDAFTVEYYDPTFGKVTGTLDLKDIQVNI